jgi:hypothetical protein
MRQIWFRLFFMSVVLFALIVPPLAAQQGFAPPPQTPLRNADQY